MNILVVLGTFRLTRSALTSTIKSDAAALRFVGSKGIDGLSFSVLRLGVEVAGRLAELVELRDVAAIIVVHFAFLELFVEFHAVRKCWRALVELHMIDQATQAGELCTTCRTTKILGGGMILDDVRRVLCRIG